jgi:hypothetical protein
MKRFEELGMAIVFAGLLLLTAAFAVTAAAPHVDGTMTAPLVVASR